MSRALTKKKEKMPILQCSGDFEDLFEENLGKNRSPSIRKANEAFLQSLIGCFYVPHKLLQCGFKSQGQGKYTIKLLSYTSLALVGIL